MSPWLVIPALVLLAGKGTPKSRSDAKGETKIVLNRARLMAEPKFWARHVGEVERGAKVSILETQSSWVKITDNHNHTGYVPVTTFVDDAVDASQLGRVGEVQDNAPVSAAQAANASRGFSREAQQAAVDKAHAQAADAWVDKYEGKDNDAALEKALAAKEPGFITDGHLLGGKP
ncbi:MAG: SH3 domain-containing protein [Deltaproteobacteria bacterium]|nr:SH3 domain-containing protein [Deltaproteobacteria bacterium]